MRHLWVHFALFIANAIYGGNYTVAKLVMPKYILPFGFIVLRVLAALALYFMIHRLWIRERVHKSDLLRLALCGLFGVALNQMLFFKGLSITTPINAALIMTTTPVLVLLASHLIIRERITSAKITGIILGAAGAIMIIVFGKDFSFGSQTLEGDLYIFFNAASYGIYLVLVKSLMKKYHPLTIIKWVFLFGSLVVVPIGYDQAIHADWQSLLIYPNWLPLVYVVVGTTFIAYLLNTIALKQVNPSVVSIYIYLQPFLAALIAIIFGKDSLTLVKILACVLIFAGVYLVSKKSPVKTT